MVYIYICVVYIYLCIRIWCAYDMYDAYIYMCTPTQQHVHVYKSYSACKDSLRVCTHLVDSIYTCFVGIYMVWTSIWFVHLYIWFVHVYIQTDIPLRTNRIWGGYA